MSDCDWLELINWLLSRKDAASGLEFENVVLTYFCGFRSRFSNECLKMDGMSKLQRNFSPMNLSENPLTLQTLPHSARKLYQVISTMLPKIFSSLRLLNALMYLC